MSVDEDVVNSVLRRVLAASDALADAADALRHLAGHLNGPGGVTSQSAIDLGQIDTPEAGEVLTTLLAAEHQIAAERERLTARARIAREDRNAAEQAAAEAMRALGAAEAELDLVDDPEYLGKIQEQVDEARAAAQAARERAVVAADRLEHLEAEKRAAAQEHELAQARIDQARIRTRELRAAQTQEVPVRELALTALAEIGVPCPSNLLSRYINARFGRDVKSTRWGPLRADERKAYERADEATRTERVWLQPAVDMQGTELPRLWVRSDWEPSKKRVHEVGERPLLDARAAYLAELAIDPPEGTADPKALQTIAFEEAERVGKYPTFGQDEDDWLTNLAQYADYVVWPPPDPPPPPSDDDVPF